MSEVIQYEQLVAFLKHASLFEIYRLSATIENEMENPTRIASIRKKFKEGDIVEYFNAETNTLIAARVLKKNPKYVSVQNCADGKRWKLPYYLFKIDSREFDFSSSAHCLSKNAVKVVDWVDFNKDDEKIVGWVERLNQKAVFLITEAGHRWRVAYQLLYAVIERQVHQPRIIEHQS